MNCPTCHTPLPELLEIEAEQDCERDEWEEAEIRRDLGLDEEEVR